MTATKTPAKLQVDTTENTAGNGAHAAADAPETVTDADTRPAPDRIAGAVWSALTDNPGATAATLATEAGVAKATVHRALKDLEMAGYAARTPGGNIGGKRAADTWNATPADATPADGDSTDAGVPDAADDTPAASPLEEPDTDTGTGTTATVDTDASGDADQLTGDGDAAGEAMDEAAVTEAREALAALTAVINAASDALNAGDRSAVLEAAETIYGDSAKARRLIKAAAKPRARSGSGQPRSHPGELRSKVAAHLAAHPGLQLTPHEIGKVIGHSAGAIANALDKLTEEGQAVLTCDRPRRFTTTATETADGTASGAKAAATS
ncbi:winged helix-turn-helix transcriptional regulator [Actinoallomurus iriomotensis]|uniref:HTH iclR-type domain-containing protein n=1 Tax=Actinoallomurus iriomotensis TaxID=478107 RepID=A0A9W6RPT5_9ACTN|nr:winged helix-turn-helix transcriptional regulator [Actinoallomurus iriomotensis]GLY79185.1 hypothetical protein Airi01_074520 [Actinoallomurus iriomotensis]